MAVGILALLDDISTILDDVAAMTKVAAKQTAGVLGDDLALNANQVSGVRANRELPVVWQVAKGSLVNKAILVPLALVISAISPKLVTGLLMLGGLYLCFEGAEKVVEKFFGSHQAKVDEQAEVLQANASDHVDLAALEKQKVKGAVRTDFILSAEIIVISLGTIDPSVPLIDKALTLTLIAVIMTVGVYGVVAMIVKFDDVGAYLQRQSSSAAQKLGRGIIALAPVLMKLLSVIGTLAMFLVGGGILAHGIGVLHHGIEHLGNLIGAFSGVTTNLLNGITGLVAGLIVLAVVHVVEKMRHRA
ncbi:DUF808 domain-containing protein [Moraxella atlantae]|uniref:Inner membrane protein yedI n=1 Tax=Faucicola atlantae TaxID=34059 RepID=A0A378Q203_9GAMM|nr:DUF808 domain-containing protein [Moraxella atlantae]OPH33962.1 hypothetical protein B5J92_08725 [Moraxella atlantae]STY94685.1 Inner membrane protein yedI [Moraxella atlantae]